MDQEGAISDKSEATPIFAAFRRGYDPDQVDRYVADQRRRLDEALQRASDAERKLAAAVGQLRELHRRIAVLENDDRNAQTPAIDAIGERIQRILQEAWDSAYAMRQAAESDAGELRERARQEADEILAEARRKARELGAALERRRENFLQRVDEERSKAVAQTTFLQEQRKLALEELSRIRTRIDGTIGDFAERSEAPPPRPAPRGEAAPTHDLRAATPSRDASPSRRELEHAARPVTLVAPARAQSAARPLRDRAPAHRPSRLAERPPERAAQRPAEERSTEQATEQSAVRPIGNDDLARTMPVHQLHGADGGYEHDASELVRLHRSRRGSPDADETAALERPRSAAGIFDFEQASSPEGSETER